MGIQLIQLGGNAKVTALLEALDDDLGGRLHVRLCSISNFNCLSLMTDNLDRVLLTLRLATWAPNASSVMRG